MHIQKVNGLQITKNDYLLLTFHDQISCQGSTNREGQQIENDPSKRHPFKCEHVHYCRGYKVDWGSLTCQHHSHRYPQNGRGDSLGYRLSQWQLLILRKLIKLGWQVRMGMVERVLSFNLALATGHNTYIHTYMTSLSFFLSHSLPTDLTVQN